jgi:erythromycin esterase
MRTNLTPENSNLDLISRAVERQALPLRDKKDLKLLLQRLSSAKIVMLGEASHGTQEFYEWRRLISQELIAHHGFHFIAVEGDWPACYQLNRFVKGEIPGNAKDALSNFQRWPTWMWANTDIIELAHWLRYHNQEVGSIDQAGFYGLDVYSLFESIEEVLKQCEKLSPTLAAKIRDRYECFEAFNRDERFYAKSLSNFPEGCEDEVLNNLRDLLQLRVDKIRQSESLFDAQQNARIVANAESYYRAMVLGGEDSWNIRDRHMMDTLDSLLKHSGPDSKAIVWAHNTHIGDYRATDMVTQGQVNIGGLAREKYGNSQVQLVGFSTYEGKTTASRAWNGPTLSTTVPPAMLGSYEAVFHQVAKRSRMDNFILPLRDKSEEALARVLGHRAIGVVYNPLTERYGNYVPTSLSNRYDAMIFLDHTHALTALPQKFNRKDIPETWPQGL